MNHFINLRSSPPPTLLTISVSKARESIYRGPSDTSICSDGVIMEEISPEILAKVEEDFASLELALEARIINMNLPNQLDSSLTLTKP